MCSTSRVRRRSEVELRFHVGPGVSWRVASRGCGLSVGAAGCQSGLRVVSRGLRVAGRGCGLSVGAAGCQSGTAGCQSGLRVAVGTAGCQSRSRVVGRDCGLSVGTAGYQSGLRVASRSFPRVCRLPLFQSRLRVVIELEKTLSVEADGPVRPRPRPRPRLEISTRSAALAPSPCKGQRTSPSSTTLFVRPARSRPVRALFSAQRITGVRGWRLRSWVLLEHGSHLAFPGLGAGALRADELLGAACSLAEIHAAAAKFVGAKAAPA